jgi:hypothetical protein
MKPLLVAAALVLAALPVAAQQPASKGPTSEQVHEMERLRFGFGTLRPARDADPKGANPANFDES